MRKFPTVFALGVLVLASALGLSAAGTANPVVHSATGSGHQDDVDAVTGEVFNRTFSFSAVQYPDGLAEGNAQIESRKFDLVIHMRIDCLYFSPDGKTARLSGVVTRTSRPFADAPVGEVHRITVQDNGEPGAGVDKFSGVPANPLGRDCDDVDVDFGVPPTRTISRERSGEPSLHGDNEPHLPGHHGTLVLLEVVGDSVRRAAPGHHARRCGVHLLRERPTSGSVGRQGSPGRAQSTPGRAGQRG